MVAALRDVLIVASNHWDGQGSEDLHSSLATLRRTSWYSTRIAR
jgi:hypothetical protein